MPKRKTPASTFYTDAAGGAPNKRSKASARRVAEAASAHATDELPPEHFEAVDDVSPASVSDSATAADGTRGARDTENKKNGDEEASKESDAPSPRYDHSRPEEPHGIVQRAFYPAEMSNERCAQYNANELPRPIEVLERATSETAESRRKIPVGECVVHWFKRDLRLHDSRGLGLAARKAREAGVPLVCVFIASPEDYQAHLTSAARVDFELRTLRVMKADLEALDIPLFVQLWERRKEIPGRLVELWRRWGARHVFCNIEYEVDELRREAKLVRMCAEEGIDFMPVHDDVVVTPGELKTGKGDQYAVYSPWYRAWVAHVHAHPGLLEASEMPERNPGTAREKFKEVFEMEIPQAPENKRLTEEERERFARLWPAGEHEAMNRLEKFLREKIGAYKDSRNMPGKNSTAMLSVHHAAGTLAARTSVRMARDVNKTKKLDGGNEGIKGWIGEVAWRDFYKHVLAHWPYVW